MAPLVAAAPLISAVATAATAGVGIVQSIHDMHNQKKMTNQLSKQSQLDSDTTKTKAQRSLSLIGTGSSSGVLDDATVGRKSLLG